MGRERFRPRFAPSSLTAGSCAEIARETLLQVPKPGLRREKAQSGSTNMMGTSSNAAMQGDRYAANPSKGPSALDTLSPETTIDLLMRVKAGDDEALDRLLGRCLPALRRWAHGRLPSCARDLQETADLVQDTILSALKRLDRFEPRHEGALQAYLREALVNRIRDIIRKKVRRPIQTELPEDLAGDSLSPLEQMLGKEKMERF